VNDIGSILAKAGKAVAAVFSGFGGFLLNVQPPEGVLKGFTIGFATAISTLVFLVLSLFVPTMDRKKYRRIALSVTLMLFVGFVITGLEYQDMFSQLTLDFPERSGMEKLVIGDQMTPRAAVRERETPEPLTTLLLDFGGKTHREDVWTRESINKAKVRLSNGYLRMSVFIAATIFCLGELLFPSKKQKGGVPRISALSRSDSATTPS
jgi:hypothetical protein